ncbi:MAG: CehA/McbA family metallohydrolase, partial [Minicystis sp.]
GNIVDAADAVTRRDELGQVFTYFGTFPRQALYDSMKSGVDAQGAAWIEVRGHELYEEELSIVTRYELGPGRRALLISTTLENHKSAPIEKLDLGDAIQWGSASKFAPGKEMGFKGDFTGPFVGAAGSTTAYGIAPAGSEPDLPAIFAKNGTAWSNVSFQRDVTIAPGRKARYDRVLVIGPRGDTLGTATEIFYLRGGAPGGLEVALRDPRGARLAPPEGAKILLTPLAATGSPASAYHPFPSLWIRIDHAIATSGKNAAAELPPGRYEVSFEGAGRHGLGAVPVTIAEGQVASVTVAVSDGGAMKIALNERAAGALRPSPGKVQIFEETSDKRASLPLLITDGRAELPLAPGRYRLVASRGPEFSIAEQRVTIEGGKTAEVALTIEHVVDTKGFLACDLHQHSAPSADSGVSMAERVASNVAEGVECAVGSEHNVIVDFAPVVEKLGVQAFFRSIIGDELTSDASREPFGHVNAFPLPFDPKDARGGAIPVRDRTAKQAFDAILAVPGEHVIQINHPRLGRYGYLDQLQFDRATGVGRAPGYDGRFDALEVWNGRYVKERDRVLDDLWALLRTGHPVTPTANTDTHGIVDQEAGYPRTWIRMPDDDPARFDPAALIDGLRRRRDVILGNGPFLTMRVAEVEQGGLVSLGPRPVELRVHVERAPWMDVSELVLWVGGEARAPIALHGQTSPTGSLIDDLRLRITRTGKKKGLPPAKAAPGEAASPLEIEADTFLVAVVQGKKPLSPVLSGDPQEILPFAMTAPLWLDADGDGKALGR